MSQDVEIVRGFFDSWNDGDMSAVKQLFASDVRGDEVGGRLDRAEVLGREDVHDGLESLFETWQSYRLEPEEMRDVDGRVLAIVREVARGRASGLEIEGRWGYVITVHEGKVAHVDAYRDPDQALAAVGLDDAR